MKEARFSRKQWSNYKIVKDDKPRTNNAVESWHNSFNYQLNHPHPTFWSFIDALKREQSRSEFEIMRNINGVKSSPPRNRGSDNKRLKKIVSSYADKMYDNKIVYVKAIASCLDL